MPGRRTHRLPQRLDFTLIPAPLDLLLTGEPTDLSVSGVAEKAEKSPFPAIIITPSSPAYDNDYSIAFLHETPQQQPTLFNRLRSSFTNPHTPEHNAGYFPPSPHNRGRSQHRESSEEAQSLLMQTQNPAGSFAFGADSQGLVIGGGREDGGKWRWRRLRTTFLMALIIVLLMCHLAFHSLLARTHVLDMHSSGSVLMKNGDGILQGDVQPVHALKLSSLVGQNDNVEDNAPREFVVIETRPAASSTTAQEEPSPKDTAYPSAE
ncbi:hypothetical protein BDV98DRAFT_586439 [Pterulicium gracile]|uniref:Uncharacterized protein n=1 Tax=Pterulicium gracile TaxID=1884261 RepID=A0A5C3Q491_9AGAR|nr:hypothetical protein BDV98DRAFT_586439 [Pterula gracilis]